MRRFYIPAFAMLLATLSLCAAVHTTARAAAYGIEDGAKMFSPETIAKANELINDIRVGDDRDVLVATFPGVPPERMAEMNNDGKPTFFKHWAERVAKDHGVSGVMIFMTKNPGHLQIEVGNKTARQFFTFDDRDELNALMLEQLKQKNFNSALIDGLQFIEDRMKHPVTHAAHPAHNGAAGSNSPNPMGTSNLPNGGKSNMFIGFVCIGIAIIAVVAVILAVASRNRGGYGGGGYGGNAGGGYAPGGGYPQQGGYYGGGNQGGGGGGGGFGRGLLGGILGGALGAWGYERFNQGANSPNYTPPPSGGGGDNYTPPPDQTDTSYSGTGGDFDSSPDSSSSSGGDFGSSSDSGGGGDFGSGSDSGGGDFGSGGDSGGGGGGDF